MRSPEKLRAELRHFIPQQTGVIGRIPVVIYCVILNFLLLFSVTPPAVITVTVPVVAPAGTLVVISLLDTTVKLAAVPLKLTPTVPVKLFPKIKTLAPTLPNVGRVSINGPNPTDMLNTVPTLSGPPRKVSP